MQIDSHQHFWTPARGDYGWMPKDNPILWRSGGPFLRRTGIGYSAGGLEGLMNRRAAGPSPPLGASAAFEIRPRGAGGVQGNLAATEVDALPEHARGSARSGLKHATGMFPVRPSPFTLHPSPIIVRQVRQVRPAASLSLCWRPRLPVGAACQIISESNQIVREAVERRA